MSWRPAFVCDNCETTLATPGEQEDEIFEAGWTVVLVPELEDEVHLCSERCVAVWAFVRARVETT